jgi:hypothetical protein
MPAAPRTVASVDDDAELPNGLERPLNAYGLRNAGLTAASLYGRWSAPPAW